MLVKKLLIIVITIVSSALYSQIPDWSATLYVQQADSEVADTIVIGLDYEATEGYDMEYDIIDTNFSYPLGIRTGSVSGASDSATCPANMKVNIMPFADIVTWDVYVISDSFDYFGEEYVTLYWDTSEYVFSDGFLALDYVFATSDLNYFGAIDLNVICISSNQYCNGLTIYYWDRAPLLYQFLNPDEYLVGECATDRNVYHFQIHAVIKDLTSLESAQDTHPVVINHQAGQILEVTSAASPLDIRIFSYTGSMVFFERVDMGTHSIDYSALPNGAYVIQVVDETNSSTSLRFFKQ